MTMNFLKEEKYNKALESIRQYYQQEKNFEKDEEGISQPKEC